MLASNNVLVRACCYTSMHALQLCPATDVNISPPQLACAELSQCLSSLQRMKYEVSSLHQKRNMFSSKYHGAWKALLINHTSRSRAHCHQHSSINTLSPEHPACCVSSSAEDRNLPLYILLRRRCRQISSSGSGPLLAASLSPPDAQR